MQTHSPVHNHTIRYKFYIFVNNLYAFISDCVLVTSEEGHFYYKATGDESTVCGVYLLTDPDKMVEIYFDYLDVPCQTGGLISVSLSSNTFMNVSQKIEFN